MFTGISIITLISWASAGIGIFGVTGLILLFIFAPALAQTVLVIIKDFFATMLSTRVGVGILVGGTCLTVGYFYGDHLGRTAEDAKYAAAVALANQQADERDKTIGAQANADSQARIKDLLSANDKYQQQIADYITLYNKAVAGGKCVLTPADVLKLR